MNETKKEKYRVTTLLTEEEKEDLQDLAWRNGRSVSGYLRYLILLEIEANSN